MAKFYDEIFPDLQDFIRKQHLFFVASAPLSAEGHVNVSPKGMDCFHIFDSHRVAYLDLTGSGNETSAHLRENGRITFMWCAFDGPPHILRLFGHGQAIRPDHSNWDALAENFTLMPGTRQIIVADIDMVQTSCGFAVPLYEYQGDRDTLIRWAETKGDLHDYWQEKNTCSIDGLPTSIAQEVVTEA